MIYTTPHLVQNFREAYYLLNILCNFFSFSEIHPLFFAICSHVVQVKKNKKLNDSLYMNSHSHEN